MKKYMQCNISAGCVMAGFLLIFHSSAAQKINSVAVKPKLVFQSGFEGTSRVITNSKNVPSFIPPGYAIDDITGVDNTFHEKNNWVKDLDDNPDAGQFLIE